MKISSLLVGLLLGGFVGFGLAKHFTKPSLGPSNEMVKMQKEVSVANETWIWPDSLDALNAAPDNHKVVYEDSSVRVLAVTLGGGKSEPIHTHKWKSIMWISKPIVPCQINSYQKDKNGQLIKYDSVTINDMPIDIGQLIDPEGPTSIANLGYESGIAYRVELKKDFK